MKTTVDIPEKVLKEAMRFSKAGTKREAVLAALEDYNRRHRMAKLVRFLGKSDGFYSDEELQSLRKMD
jgi:Arc/MetJ family transcription regulator